MARWGFKLSGQTELDTKSEITKNVQTYYSEVRSKQISVLGSYTPPKRSDLGLGTTESFMVKERHKELDYSLSVNNHRGD